MFETILFWEASKEWLSSTSQLAHWQLHVLGGLSLFMGFVRLLRLSPSSLVPLLPVTILELANEAIDFSRYHISGWPWTPRATLADIALTLGPPVVIVIVARHRPRHCDSKVT